MTSQPVTARTVGGRPIKVALLRDLRLERRVSMERFANGIEAVFADDAGILMEPVRGDEGVETDGSTVGPLRRYRYRYLRYPRLIRRRNVDAFHITDQGYADLARCLPEDKTIVTCHDLMLLRAAEGAAGFQGRRLTTARFRWSVSHLKRVAHVACDSEATRRDLIRLCEVDPRRTSVVPPGVEPHFRRIAPEARAALRNGSGRPTLLHVTTGHPYKNVPATLKILGGLRDAGIDAELHRVGPALAGGDEGLARSLGVTERVVEHGRVSDERLVELYNSADVFVFPSFWEGFGWPPLEAMACGTPVVASDRASLPEVIGNAGITLDPDDIGGLVGAVRAVLESLDLRQRLSEDGPCRAAEFTWERTAARYRTLYFQIAEGRDPCVA